MKKALLFCFSALFSASLFAAKHPPLPNSTGNEGYSPQTVRGINVDGIPSSASQITGDYRRDAVVSVQNPVNHDSTRAGFDWGSLLNTGGPSGIGGGQDGNTEPSDGRSCGAMYPNLPANMTCVCGGDVIVPIGTVRNFGVNAYERLIGSTWYRYSCP